MESLLEQFCVVEDVSILDRETQCFFLLNHIKFQSVPFLTSPFKLSIHPLGPHSVQSIGAAKAVSLAVGHNPGRVATPIQWTSMLELILPTLEG